MSPSVVVLLLFIVGFVIDLVASLYVLTLTEARAGAAASTAMFLSAAGLAVNWSVIEGQNKVGAIAYVLGCGLGTWVVAKYWKKRKVRKPNAPPTGDPPC